MKAGRNFALLAVWAILPPAVLFFINGNFFESIILYLALPSIYFSYKNPGVVSKALTIGTFYFKEKFTLMRLLAIIFTIATIVMVYQPN